MPESSPSTASQPAPTHAGRADVAAAGSNALVAVTSFYVAALNAKAVESDQLRLLLEQCRRAHADEHKLAESRAVCIDGLGPVLDALANYLSKLEINGLPETAADVALDDLNKRWLAARADGILDATEYAARRGEIRASQARS